MSIPTKPPVNGINNGKLNAWVPPLTTLLSTFLVGVLVVVIGGFRDEIKDFRLALEKHLTKDVVDIRERLARVETMVGHINKIASKYSEHDREILLNNSAHQR